MSSDIHFRENISTKNTVSCPYGYVTNGETCDSCGETSFPNNARIVGGVEAVPYSWPAQVYLVIEGYGYSMIPPNSGNYVYITKNNTCGGTIINRYTILTAAHCIITNEDTGLFINVNDPNNLIRYKVYVGAYDISLIDSPDSPDQILYFPTSLMKVKKIITHPKYNEENMLNDIALLILADPIEFNKYIQPACLPSPTYGPYPEDNTPVFAIGWGDLNYDGETPNKLQNVKLTNYNKELCVFVSPLSVKNWDSQLCCGEIKGGKDACQGDSGGGLYSLDNKTNKYVVSGITSYGDGCAFPFLPGIYTKTSYYYNWIVSNMGLSNETSTDQTINNLNSGSILRSSLITLFTPFILFFLFKRH